MTLQEEYDAARKEGAEAWKHLSPEFRYCYYRSSCAKHFCARTYRTGYYCDFHGGQSDRNLGRRSYLRHRQCPFRVLNYRVGQHVHPDRKDSGAVDVRELHRASRYGRGHIHRGWI
jgi:hypothetical protein